MVAPVYVCLPCKMTIRTGRNLSAHRRFRHKDYAYDRDFEELNMILIGFSTFSRGKQKDRESTEAEVNLARVLQPLQIGEHKLEQEWIEKFYAYCKSNHEGKRPPEHEKTAYAKQCDLAEKEAISLERSCWSQGALVLIRWRGGE